MLPRSDLGISYFRAAEIPDWGIPITAWHGPAHCSEERGGDFFK